MIKQYHQEGRKTPYRKPTTERLIMTELERMGKEFERMEKELEEYNKEQAMKQKKAYELIGKLYSENRITFREMHVLLCL